MTHDPDSKYGGSGGGTVVVVVVVVVGAAVDGGAVVSGARVVVAGAVVVESAVPLQPAASDRATSPARTGPGNRRRGVRFTSRLSLRELNEPAKVSGRNARPEREGDYSFATEAKLLIDPISPEDRNRHQNAETVDHYSYSGAAAQFVRARRCLPS